MKVDRQQLLEDGYIILRNVIPPSELDKMRAGVETLVSRQRAIWARDRKPNEPSGGQWDVAAQPRVILNQVVDAETAYVIDFFIGENTLGVAQQLTKGPKMAPIVMWVMCNPIRDHGPADWHRDLGPHKEPPLRGLQADLLENGPGFVQWNVPLYDDDVLWVVPRSHRRINTEQEDLELLANSRAPLSSGMPVRLRAGDGVVYLNALLHWGSNYSAKLRRTLHFGGRAFEGPNYPYVFDRYWEPDFTDRLPDHYRETFHGFARLWSEEWDIIESLFRAMIDRNAVSFDDNISRLHPGKNHRMVFLTMLSKVAQRVRAIKASEVENDSKASAAAAPVKADVTQTMYQNLSARFTADEVETIWKRFVPLDSRLQSDEEQFVPGFQSGPTKYNFYDMPANFDIEDLVNSWA